MKLPILLLATALLCSPLSADTGGNSSRMESAPTIEKHAVVSDDGALRMSIISHPGGRVAAIVVVDQAFDQTFVFPIEESPRKNAGRQEPGLQSEGDVPDGATLEFMGCAGSVCSYGVFLGDSYLGTLIVDYSGPQPKATFQPPQ